MSDPEPEIQASADLSPVSPSPVHSAASGAVPALQETVDTIEAMVAQADALAEPILDVAAAAAPENNVDVVDDESFDDAYGQGEAEAHAQQVSTEQPTADNDDYAATFDSPAGSPHGDPAYGDAIDAAIMPTTGDLTQASAVTSGTATPTAHAPIAQQHAQIDAANAQSAASSVPSAAPSGTASKASSVAAANQDIGLDIGQLVADLTSGSAQPDAATSTSLPPRPPVSQENSQPKYGDNEMHTLDNGMGFVLDTTGASANRSSASGPPANAPTEPRGKHNPRTLHASRSDDFQRQWDTFVTDERQYMADAKWDRFPEGSRLFIGNLSSDKVTKRDVFDIFRKYGRLAQISLKPAYGFVQYHTVEEGHRAVANLQDAEVMGRRIHLEVSKLQEKSKKERRQSPERDRNSRGKRGERGERGDRGERGERGGNRDDSGGRGGRNKSPRRNGRDRGGRRGRSRSPAYERQDKDGYRRRSPSPRERSRQDDDLDLPRRYGPEVPDLQFILQQEVDRNFVSWAEQAFQSKGLKTEVMFLHPRFPKDKVIQRQAAEGVHAIIELDFRCQNTGKIPLQVFDRSGGPNNVRFDKYADLDPVTAAEVTLRAKASNLAANYNHQHPPQHAPPPPQQQYGYPQPAYGTQPPPAAYPPQQPAQQPAQPPAGANLAELASMMSKMDNATLTQLLSVVQAGNAQQAAPTHAPAPAQPDLQAILGALGTGAPAQAPAGPQYGGYGQAAPIQPGHAAPPQSGEGNSAAQVQNIMAQLSRFR